MYKVNFLVSSVILTLLYLKCTSCNKLMNLTIYWWENPPYIYKENGKIQGLIPSVLSAFSNQTSVCGQTINVTFNASTSNHEILKNIEGIIHNKYGENISRDGVHAYVPLYRNNFSNMLKYVKIAESAGQILVYRKVMNNKLYRSFVIGFHACSPLFIFFSLIWVIFGLLMWIVESNHNSDQFSKNFFRGAFDGIYWAGVTVTTVGYGDKVPKTLLGKLIALIWMGSGVLLVAISTALLTSGITESSISLEGHKVALVYTPNFNQIVVSQRGIPIYTDTYDEAFQMVRDGKVFAALADTNVVAKLQNKLWNEYSLDVGTSFPTNQGVYMLLHNEDWEANAKFWKCISASSKYLNMEKLQPNQGGEVLNSKYFNVIMILLACFTGLLLAFGFIKHFWATKKKKKSLSVSNGKDNMNSRDKQDNVTLHVVQPLRCNCSEKGGSDLTMELRQLGRIVKAQGEALERIERTICSKWDKY